MTAPPVAICGVSGSPQLGSTTSRAVTQITAAIRGTVAIRGGEATTDLVDCAALGAAVLDQTEPVMVAAIDAISGADVVVIGSPTYRGSYTGVLKCLLDELPRGALQHTLVLPVAVYQAERHRDVVLGSLNTTLGELGAALICPALAISQDDVEKSIASYMPLLTSRLTISQSGRLALQLSKERHDHD